MIEADEMYAGNLRSEDIGKYILWHDPADANYTPFAIFPIKKITLGEHRIKVKTSDGGILKFFTTDRVFVSEERPEGA